MDGPQRILIDIVLARRKLGDFRLRTESHFREGPRNVVDQALTGMVEGEKILDDFSLRGSGLNIIRNSETCAQLAEF